MVPQLGGPVHPIGPHAAPPSFPIRMLPAGVGGLMAMPSLAGSSLAPPALASPPLPLLGRPPMVLPPSRSTLPLRPSLASPPLGQPLAMAASMPTTLDGWAALAPPLDGVSQALLGIERQRDESV